MKAAGGLGGEPASDRAESAEASPWFRKAAKVVAVAAWIFATLAAMAMTFDVMVAKAGPAPEPWLLVALVTIGLACDFWVGVGPVLILSAWRWGVKLFAWVAGAGLLLALTITFTNKVDFWGSRADSRQAVAERVEIAAGVDTSARDRALVDANQTVRPLSVVQAELAGVETEIATLRERGFRLRLAQAEQRLTALRAEAALVSEVESARARLTAAASVAAQPDLATPPQEHLARDRWIAGVLTGLAARYPAAFGGWASVTPGLVEAWMNGLFAVFHELLCLTALMLGTLGQPAWAIRREALAKAAKLAAKDRAALEIELEVSRIKGRVELEALRQEALLRKERVAIERDLAAALAEGAAAPSVGGDGPPDLVAQPLRPEPPLEPSFGPDFTPRRPSFLDRLFGARGEGWRYFARDEIRRPSPPPSNPDDEAPRWTGKALPGFGWGAGQAERPTRVRERVAQDAADDQWLAARRDQIRREIEALEAEKRQLQAADADAAAPEPDPLIGRGLPAPDVRG